MSSTAALAPRPPTPPRRPGALLAEATSALFHTEAEKRRKGVWIDIDSGGDDNQIERSSAVASEGSTVTAAASVGSTATSGTCRRAPRAGCATCAAACWREEAEESGRDHAHAVVFAAASWAGHRERHPRRRQRQLRHEQGDTLVADWSDEANKVQFIANEIFTAGPAIGEGQVVF
ncbi:hypothetical protein Zm00014a_004873 [Zea mays]|uniref:Uncharacterized protein n=1 Tax=Zea mays TaxID=4577 RepID=A0A3L6FP03_MAIZE|nr:hypothetical protein Zm00014a_004873 [Zea mays]